MRIEEVTKSKLSKAKDKELLILKLRFTQLWDKNFKDNDIAVVGSLDRSKFLKNYRLCLTEMNSRDIAKSTSHIDKAVFKKVMTARTFGLDVTDLDDIVVAENFITMDANGATIEKALEGITAPEECVTAALEQLSISKSAPFIPLYDLVLKAKPETMVIEVSKPFPNEHSARLQDPDKFDDKSFRRTKGGSLHGSKKVPTTISIIWGKLKGKAKPSDPPIPQALRFPIGDWTATKARKWLKDNEIKFTSFETATKKTKKLWNKKYIEDLPDEAFLHINKKGKRFYPYIDKDGNVDMARLENVSNEIAKSELSETVQKKVQINAEKVIEDIKNEKVFEKDVSVYPVDKADDDEHIVYGVVYEPDEEDAQGDMANEIEIRKAAYGFMEKVQSFKVMHKGKKVKVKVLESYIAPVEFKMALQTIKKGSWVLSVRVLDKKIWKAIKDGDLTGFSMAGYAKTS